MQLQIIPRPSRAGFADFLKNINREDRQHTCRTLGLTVFQTV
jgi:hypothetical protein